MSIKKIINEVVREQIQHLILERRNDINAILRRYFQKNIPQYIGCNGSIDSHLFSLDDEIETDYDEYGDEYISDEDLPFVEQIYKQYADSMARRRPDSVLEEYRFISYIMNYALCFNYKDSYVFGQFSNGYFKVSHFAPSTMREGYEMLRELSTFDNVIFSVTDDLSPMLERIGFYGNDKAKIMMFFRDELVNKQIYTTDRELLDYFVKQIIDDNYQELYKMFLNNDNEQDFREIVRKPKIDNIEFTQRVSMHDKNYRKNSNIRR